MVRISRGRKGREQSRKRENCKEESGCAVLSNGRSLLFAGQAARTGGLENKIVHVNVCVWSGNGWNACFGVKRFSPVAKRVMLGYPIGQANESGRSLPIRASDAAGAARTTTG